VNYCKIYIDSNADKAAMDSLLDEGVALFFGGGVVECDVFRNEVYFSNAASESLTYPIDRSRYYVEIDTDSDVMVTEDAFRLGVWKMIVWLRERAIFVVASCDFEDYVVEITGWNWTPEQPLPPASRINLNLV